MIVVQFPAATSPTAQAAVRRMVSPVREEWQPDGTWTGLFDVPNDQIDEFYERVKSAGGEGTRTKEIESEADIGGHRMALYAFD